MNHRFFHRVLSLSFLLIPAFLILSCGGDPCNGVFCGSFGECIDGNCSCEAGYQKDSLDQCNVRTAEMLSGIYLATTTGCNISDYFLTIQADAFLSAGLEIVNLGQYTCNNSGGELVIQAIVTGANQFEIAAQDLYCNQYSVIGGRDF